MTLRYPINLILLIMCILISGCSYKEVGLSDCFILSADEIKQLEPKAIDGDLDAARRLVDYYRFIDYDNRSERLKWLRLLAESGSANDKYNLAFELLLDSTSLNDKQEGIIWLKEAAEGGVSEAQKRLAKLYETGNILEKDYCKSKYWYEKEAYHGDMFTMIKLAELYSTGKCGERDNIKALTWLFVADSVAKNEVMRNMVKEEKDQVLYTITDDGIVMLTDDEIDIARAESIKIINKLTLDYF